MARRSAAIATGTAWGATVGAFSRGPSLVPWPTAVRRVFPFATGALSGIAVASTAGTCSSAVMALAGRGRGPLKPLVATAGVAAVLGAAGAVVARQVLSGLDAKGAALDEGYSDIPTSPTVSGSAASSVPLWSLGREGARFVHGTVDADTIRKVTGKDPVAEPARVFVGVMSAESVDQRVALAMDELRRTGAFDRANLIIQAPAGTGFANSTPIDVTEILALGDCASVAIGYGLLPSFLSLGKVDLGARTQRALLDAITQELRGRSSRPRLLLYGESLGAKVQEAAIPGGPIDMDRYGIDAALWVGSPGSSASDAFHALCVGESVTVDRPEQITAHLAARTTSTYPRTWFLEHDGDPVVRFRPELLAHRPAWLPVNGTRGRNIPEQMTWKPGITWATALVDTLFATNVKAGDFQSLGHDYRADLGAVIAAAYRLPVDADTATRLEAQLRAIEIARAKTIGEA